MTASSGSTPPPAGQQQQRHRALHVHTQTQSVDASSPPPPPPPSPQLQQQQWANVRTSRGQPRAPVRSPTHGLPYDAEMMQDQMSAFVHDDLLDSALVLGEFLVALAAAPAPAPAPAPTVSDVLTPGFHARSLMLFADLLVKKREYKRAILYYKRYWKCQATVPGLTEGFEVAAFKVKIAKCWIELDNVQQAILVLVSVPTPSRTLSVNLLLGKLFLSENLKEKAEDAYRTALRQNPYALEATLALTKLTSGASGSETATAKTARGQYSTAIPSSVAEVDKMETNEDDGDTWQLGIERFYAKLSTMRGSTIKSISRVDATWLQTLVNAHLHAHNGRYRVAVEAFDALDRLFPNNLHALLQRGKLEMDQEFYHQAHLNFHRARQVDERNLALMDAHADCLRRNGARVQLNNLVHDLFETSDRHVEPWLAAAYLSEMKGEHETALQFCDRAILTHGRYAPAHLFRGALLLKLNRPDAALMAYTTSSKINRTMSAYGGMVVAYCELCGKGFNKYKEALSTALRLTRIYPQKAQSYTLLGTVLALRPENSEQARKAFQHALEMEPRKVTAVFGLVDLLVQEGALDQAIDTLVTLSEQSARDDVSTKLAEVYTLNKQYGEALTCFHRSLSLNPASLDATRGLDRLERIMRGEDPDELDTTMEMMEPDDPDESLLVE